MKRLLSLITLLIAVVILCSCDKELRSLYGTSWSGSYSYGEYTVTRLTFETQPFVIVYYRDMEHQAHKSLNFYTYSSPRLTLIFPETDEPTYATVKNDSIIFGTRDAGGIFIKR
jgi:hypothetical protein